MPRPRKSIVKKPKGKKHYEYDWTINGRRFRGSTGETRDKGRAEKIALKVYDELLENARLGYSLDQKTMTLRAAFLTYSAEYAQHLVDWPGYRSRMATIERIIGADTPLGEINTQTVLHYIGQRRSHVTKRGRPPMDATIRLEVQNLLTMMTYARKLWGVQVGQVDPDAYRKTLKRSRPMETFLRDWGQAQAVIDNITAHYHPIIKLALFTGLRKGNVVHLEWERVSIEQEQASVVQKGGRPYTVELIPPAIELLAQLEPDPERRTGPVFRFGNPNVSCPCPKCVHVRRRRPDEVHPIRFIGPIWKKACIKAGLPNLRWHDLRHTVASWLLGAGYSLQMVRVVLGHQSIASTARYAHLEKRQVRGGMTDALSPDRGTKVVPLRKTK